MPDEPAPSSDTPPPNQAPKRVGTAFAGETTRSMSETPRTGDETFRAGAAPPPEVIGGFEILGQLGQGGMGAVYRARQVSLDRVVALKILPARFEADADFVSRFQREARLAASLSHANLVKVYSSGQADGCHYIAMELVEGETLGQWLRRGALPPVEALRITLDVARALDCGWRSGQLIHRDIKPGNIFLSTSGAVKLGDLGLAKSVDSDTTGLTQTGTAMGTPHYISPEQARGDKDLDFRADIYSLGCTLYQMLTGRTPYEGRDPLAVMSMHLNSPPPAIMKVMPHCPIPLARLVGKMLKKQRRERHASYEELIAAIEGVQAHFAPKPSPLESMARRESEAALRQTPSEPPAPPPKSKLPLYGGIAAGVIFVGIAAFLLWPKEEKLTLAQIYMRDHAGEHQAAEATPAPSPANSRTAANLEPSAIKLWDSPEKIKFAGASWENGALRLERGAPRFRTPLARDAVLRARIRMNPDADSPRLGVRKRDKEEPGGEVYYRLVVNPSKALVTMDVVLGDNITRLASWPLDRHYDASEWVRFEFRAVGGQLTASADGKVLGTVNDTSITAPGGVQLYAAANGYFRDIEYVPLDKPLSPEPAAIRLWDSPEKITPSAQVRWEKNAVRLDGHPLAMTVAVRDVVIRTSILLNPDAGGPQIHARVRHGGLSASFYSFGLSRDLKLLVLGVVVDGKGGPPLKSWPLPRTLGPDEWLRLELRLVGDDITASADGKVLGTVHDSSVSGAGEVVIFAQAAGYFRDTEYVPLDQPVGVAVPSAEPWQDVLHDPAKLKLSGAVERTPGGLRFLDFGLARFEHPTLLRDGAVRVRSTFSNGAKVQAMVREGDAGIYQLKAEDRRIVLQFFDRLAQTTTELRVFPLAAPLKEGDDYELELRVVGQTLTARLNREILGSVSDSRVAEGHFSLGFTGRGGTPTPVSSLEFLDLAAPGGSSVGGDGAPPSNGTPAAR